MFDKEALFSIYLTFKIITVNTVLFLTLGNLTAYYIINENTVVKKTVSFLVDLPLAFPPIVIGFILLWIFSKTHCLGYVLNKVHINIVFSFWGLVTAGFIAGLPLYVKPVVSAVRQFPENIVEASYVSGKSRLKTFLFIVFPGIKRVFLVSLLLSVSRVLGEVGISLMLGGNIPFKTNTVSLEIFTSVFNGDLQTAFRLSAVLFAISLILYFVVKHYEKDFNRI